MKAYFGLACASACALIFIACAGDSNQVVEPEARGQRGESCRARNDCESGLACISGTCSRNDFDITPEAKQCDRVDCQEDTDCCGDRPIDPPPECADRATLCTPSLPGCVPTSCTSDSECNGGSCGTGSCSTSGSSCTSDTDCMDTCVGSFCSVSGLSCITDGDCFSSGTCVGRSCSCQNPQYDPTNPVCSNPDCTDTCTLRCVEERCVADSSCDQDSDCFARGLTLCDGGRCVACVEDDDCDVEGGETCVDNECVEPCTQNEECPLFHACEGGECVEKGCSSNRECVLAASQTGSGEDARLAQCLPSDEDPDVKVCKVPCENDGACSQFEICDSGFCKFIGCESDEECRSFLGIENEMKSESQPFVSRAVCR